MHIKRIKAKRFLCFGETQVEIDFTTLGRIINIRGENLDYGKEASNGAGKSTVLEIIVYGLYGKLLKGLNHTKANHIYSKKGLEIEIEVDNLLIKRFGSPHKLELWENGVDITPGGIPATQEEINKKLRLNYDGFVNVACFGQHSFHGFLEAELSTKRAIAENLLNLDHYARYHEMAKKQKDYLVRSICELEIKHDAAMENTRRSHSKLLTLRSQQSQWQRNRMTELSSLEARLTEILRESDKPENPITGEIARLDKLSSEIQAKRSKVLVLVREVNTKIEQIRSEYNLSQRSLVKQEAQLKEAKNLHKKRRIEIDEIEQKQGTRCPSCYGVVRAENIKVLTENLRKDFIQYGEEVARVSNQVSLESQKLTKISARLNRASEFQSKYHKEESELAIQLSGLTLERSQWESTKSTNNSTEKELIEQRLKVGKEELHNNDPYSLLIITTEEELEESKKQAEHLQKEVKQKNKLLPYYEYWVKGFGDKGLRSFLLEEKLPLLNSRINFWLQILINNRLKLNFDRDLKESIQRFPDNSKQFVYNSLSGGELMRIDLSISQAFAYVTMTSSKACPSIIALDEIGNNFDRPGKTAIYRMLCELAKERQVLVITHDPDLMEMLKTCDTIIAKMRNGVTTIEIQKA